MRIFGTIVEPFSCFLAVVVADFGHGGAIRGQPICQDGFRSAITFHRLSEKAKSGLFISGLGDKSFEHFAFVINRPPEVIQLAIDANKDLINMPSPQGIVAL